MPGTSIFVSVKLFPGRTVLDVDYPLPDPEANLAAGQAEIATPDCGDPARSPLESPKRKKMKHGLRSVEIRIRHEIPDDRVRPRFVQKSRYRGPVAENCAG